MLEKAGLQYRDDSPKKNWRIANKGKQYGEEMPFTRNGHTDYQLRWHEKVVDVLK